MLRAQVMACKIRAISSNYLETPMPSSGDAPYAPDTPPGKAALKSMAKLVAPWQPPESSASPRGDNKKSKACSLDDFDPAGKQIGRAHV